MTHKQFQEIPNFSSLGKDFVIEYMRFTKKTRILPKL